MSNNRLSMIKNNPSIQDVVDRHLCTGCGACAFAGPDVVQMVDTVDHGRRPVSRSGDSNGCSKINAVPICPGIDAGLPRPNPELDTIDELRAAWGPVAEVWEGYAVDPEIRHRGSSGGVATALALFCVEHGGMDGVVHVRARKDSPLLNETVFSQDRESLLEGAGSRYAPASPCDGLQEIIDAERPCVFIGKPCDVAGAVKVREVNPSLNGRLGLTMAILCAGTPSINGTLELARRLGAKDPADVEEIRYRGKGWPGDMTFTFRDSESGERVSRSVDYASGWGEILQRHRQWRCHVCADHTGECADLSIGDPWYRPVAADEPGRSLVLVRTAQGRRILQDAIAAGYVRMERREAWVLDASQKHLARARATIWGRTLACRIAGAAAPTYPFFRQLRLWLSRLNWREKIQSLAGTWKRVGKKRLRTAEQAEPVNEASLQPKPAEPLGTKRESALC